MIWIAAVLTVFLFYQLVERRHKIALAKIVIVLTLIGSAGAGTFYLYVQNKKDLAHRSAQERAFWLRVEYRSRNSTADQAEQERWINDLWANQESKTDFAQMFPIASKADSQIIREGIFHGYLSEKDFSLDELAIKELEVELESSEWRRLCENRVDKLIARIPELRALNDRALSAAIIEIWNARAEVKKFPDLQTRIDNALTPSELSMLQNYNFLRDRLRYRLDNIINALPTLNIFISFNVCNRRNIPLHSVNFRVAGLKHGHSTRHAITKSDNMLQSTEFKSDIIIEANECSLITWPGPYKMFSDYEVSDVTGEWQDEDE
jgi:hypothetical protein